MKHLLLSLALLLGATAAHGALLTPEQALQRVPSLPGTVMAAPTTNVTAPALAYTGCSAEVTAYYIFNRPEGGYLITSAQSEGAPLLGYSLTGRFDASQMPPAMRWWLDGMARDIAQASQNPATVDRSRLQPHARTAKEPIAPLTTTLWNQDAPYNDQCPSIGDTVAPTGCVATAMAQVLKYHNYPPKGTGQYSYQWSGQTLSFNYGATTFDWTNMTDRYTSQSTPQQKTAVATLMKACGVSVEMDYGARESGAVSELIPGALRDFFGYDAGMAFLTRDYYGLCDWENMVYNQLAKVGPVLYCGRGDGGGHQFVCDGYSQDGYFHFNWGWGGVSDGYFLLYALDPLTQGTGGSSLTGQGFSTGQGIVTGVRPPAGGTQPQAVVGITGEMEVEAYGSLITITATLSNVSGETASSFIPGAVFKGSDGVNHFIANRAGSAYTLHPGYSTGNSDFSYNVSAGSLANGTYTMRPALRWADGGVAYIPLPISVAQNAVVTKMGSSAKVSLPTVGKITVSDVTRVSPLYVDQPFKVTATFSNATDIEQLQVIRLGFATESYWGGLQLEAYGTMYPVDMLPGDSLQVNYISHIFQGSVEAGEEYEMLFFDENGQILSEPQTVTFNELTSQPEIAVDSWDVASKGGLVDPNNIRVTGTVDCTAGYWANSLYFVLLNGKTGATYTYFDSPYMFVNAGDSQVFDFTGAYPEASTEITYLGALCTLRNNTLYPINHDYKQIRFGTSGVSDFSITPAAAEPEYYTLQGQPISHPVSGTLVIERRGTTVTKVVIP